MDLENQFKKHTKTATGSKASLSLTIEGVKCPHLSPCITNDTDTLPPTSAQKFSRTSSVHRHSHHKKLYSNRRQIGNIAQQKSRPRPFLPVKGKSNPRGSAIEISIHQTHPLLYIIRDQIHSKIPSNVFQSVHIKAFILKNLQSKKPQTTSQVVKIILLPRNHFSSKIHSKS